MPLRWNRDVMYSKRCITEIKERMYLGFNDYFPTLRGSNAICIK